MIVSFLTRPPILRADGPFAPIKNQTTFSASFSRRKTTFSRSPDGWLSKRSRVCDWRTQENGSESSSLPDHRFSHSPSMAYPLAGCFVSSNLLKLRHLCRFSVWQDPPCGRRDKRSFRTLLRPLSRRFSPFEKTAGFSPKSALFHLKSRHSPLFLE